MAEWSDLFRNELVSRFGVKVDAEMFTHKFDWVQNFHKRANDILNPEYLQSMRPEDIYKELKTLTVPQCPIRMTNLGRANSAGQIVASLIKLLTVQGGFEEKYRAAKFPQAGMVTITEILCVARPHRFICRNTAFTRALTRVVPFYSKKALDELGYTEFFDICTELVKVMLDYLGSDIQWAAQVRYLLLYATLTEK